MFYAFLPPAMIVIGVAGLVWILAKRSKDVASLEISEMPEAMKAALPPRSFGGKIVFFLKNIPWNDMRVWLLAALEKMTKKTRVWFMRADSRLNELSHHIRHQRQACEESEPIATKTEDQNPAPTASLPEKTVPSSSQEMEKSYSATERNDIIQKLKEYKVRRRVQPDIVRSEKNSATQKVVIERKVRPMVSERVTEPQPNPETKNHLEKILIERIAVNARDVEAYERLGEYYLDIENYEFAKECLKQVLKLAPANRSAKYKMKKIENILAVK